MRRRVSLSLAIVCTTFLAAGTIATPAQAAGPNLVPDANLRACIASALHY